MSAAIVPATLTLADDGTPVSDTYGDVYHSAAGGPAQAEHVFLAGNGLPPRWRGRESFCVLETGFGLGVNFMATWDAWRSDPQRSGTLHFVSVEKHPFGVTDLARAHAGFPQFAELSLALCAVWPPLAPGVHCLALDAGRVRLDLVFGDAVQTLSELTVRADALYLDGFSPAKNPALWSETVCRALARLAAPGATLATWSVAGSVRRALADAGFVVEKRAGFGGKRQMLCGRRSEVDFCADAKKA